MSKKVTTAVLAAIAGPESGVTQPSRARSSSFASMVSDLRVGDHPAARTLRIDAIDPNLAVGDIMESMAAMREKLRNAVTSAVASARRRVPGADYSIEVTNLMANSGIYVVALVTRTV